ncbi:MAG: acyl-CoA dehydrogenase [Actinophytocola sp.]|uniref:acyl-CoA dehydrogenase family protein n=1 Tax=Actinophytocola sp. TaxID=1872138 RepID=UPI0013261C70|nr:acyl-CoA dehydrogenase family protein [Actinophytocola sp.]MPZ80658.1 acyl-CoA dehydrogenase [Actinophytocola sp.]
MRLTEDQLALRDTVRRLVAKEQDCWAPLTELGAPALLVPSDRDGLGAGLVEVFVVQYELGRTLTPAPLLGSVLATAALVSAGDTDLLPRVASGAVAALAWAGAGGWSSVACAARRSAGGWLVSGSAAYVLDGDTADLLLVVARTDDGPSLFEVDPADARRTHTPTMDLTRRLADVSFADAPARLIGPVDVAHARDVACVALAAEQAGTAARCLELTVSYTGRRTQFGRPIASFQALKHRMADMHVLVETAESAALSAACAAPDELPLRAAVAKAHCAEALHEVAGEMIQLHGGIAITWEHDAHRYFKRAHGGLHLFGGPAEHVARLAQLTGI